MNTETLHDAFVDELRDLYNAEKQLSKALPKLAKNATDMRLREAIQSHIEETQNQVKRLEDVFDLLDERASGKQCEGIQGILKEGDKVMKEVVDGPVLDACIIAGAQRAEHYEIAAYGTCIAWAEAMGHTNVARLLNQTLEEEKAADMKLSSIAEGGINAAASNGMSAGMDDEGVEVEEIYEEDYEEVYDELEDE